MKEQFHKCIVDESLEALYVWLNINRFNSPWEQGERCKMFSDLYQGFVKMKTTARFEGRMKGEGGGPNHDICVFTVILNVTWKFYRYTVVRSTVCVPVISETLEKKSRRLQRLNKQAADNSQYPHYNCMQSMFW